MCSRLFQGATQTTGFAPLPCQLRCTPTVGASMSFADVYLQQGLHHWQVVCNAPAEHFVAVRMGVSCPDLLDDGGREPKVTAT